MAEKTETLRYCKDCEHIWGTLGCISHYVVNQYTGIPAGIDDLTANNRGLCPSYKKKAK